MMSAKTHKETNFPNSESAIIIARKILTAVVFLHKEASQFRFIIPVYHTSAPNAKISLPGVDREIFIS